MIPLRLSPRAAADLEDIGDFIARDNQMRAATFIDELQRACRAIAEHPEAYVLRNDLLAGIRMAIHQPYLILFRILSGEIRIERILHGARDIKRALRD